MHSPALRASVRALDKKLKPQPHQSNHRTYAERELYNQIYRTMFNELATAVSK